MESHRRDRHRGLVGGIFGKGGGREVDNALVLEPAKKPGSTAKRPPGYSATSGAPTTRRPRLPPTRGSSGTRTDQTEPLGRVLPDAGTTRKPNVVAEPRLASRNCCRTCRSTCPTCPSAERSQRGALRSRGQDDGRRRTARRCFERPRRRRQGIGGRPADLRRRTPGELLRTADPLESGLARSGNRRPRCFVRRVNMYVLLGRGTNYSFSATSAGQDIIDTFAVPLCETGWKRPDKTAALPLPGQVPADRSPRETEQLDPEPR